MKFRTYIGKYVGTKDEFFMLVLPTDYDLKRHGFCLIDSVGEPVFSNGTIAVHPVSAPVLVDFRAEINNEAQEVECLEMTPSKTGFINVTDGEIFPIRAYKRLMRACEKIDNC